jgi:hypothetical protein
MGSTAAPAAAQCVYPALASAGRGAAVKGPWNK